MSWAQTISALEARGEAYVLITVLGARGSTPRDSGTKMVVSAGERHGTIGGGHLEFKAMAIAAEMLKTPAAAQRIEHFPLGAKLGQCCGGSASLLFECFPGSGLNLMLFGAGHIGKALAPILAQLPCRLYWVDSRAEEFPASLPENISRLCTDSPAAEIQSMPADSYYLIMTHNHALDFELTEAVLKRGDARYIGLIGSDTKWQRFSLRFAHRGYTPEFYQPVRCPVGLREVPGKQPIEVAVSIAAEIIAAVHRDQPARPVQQGIHWRELKSLVDNL